MAVTLQSSAGKLLWICDEWESVNNANESTLRFVDEAIHLGFENFFCDASKIVVQEKNLSIPASYLTRASNSIHCTKPTIMNLSDFNKLFYRCDPPFDSTYFDQLKAIKPFVDRTGIEMLNGIDQLLSINSKISCLHLKTPETVISSDIQTLTAFCMQKQIVVAKPLSSGGAADVELLQYDGDTNAMTFSSTLSRLMNKFNDPIVLQRFVSSFYDKEIRVWFSKGKMIAAVGKKMPSRNFPFQIQNGGMLTACELSQNQMQTVRSVEEFLINNNITMAAADMIEDMVIDLNIGSPGLVVEMEDVLKVNLANLIMRKILL